MIEKDGNTIAVVLTAASAMTAGVSVYTIATNQDGQQLLKPVVFSLDKTMQSEEFQDNYFIEKNKNTISSEKRESFLQEAISLASSILGPNEKNKESSSLEDQIVIETASEAIETTEISSNSIVTNVHPTVLSGSPIVESQRLSPTTMQYGQSIQGAIQNVEAKPTSLSTNFIQNPNIVAMADLETTNVSSYNASSSMAISNTVQTVTPVNFISSNTSMPEVAPEIEESQPDFQEEMQVLDEMMVNPSLMVDAPVEEVSDVSNVQVIVMDSVDTYQDALPGPAMAEESTPMAMVDEVEGQAFFEEGVLSTYVEENLFQAPEAEIPAPIIPEEPSVAQPEDPAPAVADPAQDPGQGELPVQDPGVTSIPEEQPPAPEEPPVNSVEEPQAPETPVVSEDPVIPEAPSYDDLNARIAEEALKLVDTTNGLWCTQVVQMAMSNAGVEDALNLWPNEFVDMYGHYTNDPQPGNLIYYNQGGNGLDHIAIYIGDGKAVHGNYSIDGESKTVIANAKLPGCDDYSFIQVER